MPNMPANFRQVPTAPPNVMFGWDAPTDDTTRYEVSRNGVFYYGFNAHHPDATGLLDNPPPEGTVVSIVAFDAAGNASPAASLTYTGSAPDPNEPPPLSGSGTSDDPYVLTGDHGNFKIPFGASPVSITYTPATDGSLVIQVTSPEDWTPSWLVYDDSGEQIQDDTGSLGLVWVADEAMRVDVTPGDGFPATLVEFSWSYAPRASSVLTFSMEYDYVEETPAGLMVDVSNGSPGETITFSMTGPTDVDTFQTATLDDFGNHTDLVVNLPAVEAGQYYLYVEGTQSGGEDVPITIENDALSWGDPTPVLPSPPTIAATTPVARWRFYDMRDETVTWTFEKNPDSWTNVFPPTDFTHGKTTAVDGQPLTWQAASRPWRMEFTGTITEKSEYDALTFWSQLHRRFWLIDHRNRAWLMTIEQFDPQAQVKPGYPWLHKYTVKTLIFMQGTTD